MNNYSFVARQHTARPIQYQIDDTRRAMSKAAWEGDWKKFEILRAHIINLIVMIRVQASGQDAALIRARLVAHEHI